MNLSQSKHDDINHESETNEKRNISCKIRINDREETESSKRKSAEEIPIVTYETT